MVITISHQGYIKRIRCPHRSPAHRGKGAYRNGNKRKFCCLAFIGSTPLGMLSFSNLRLYWLKDLSASRGAAKGKALINLINCQKAENYNGALVRVLEGFLVMFTRTERLKDRA